MIPPRMQALGEQGRISAAIFFGREYNWADKRKWSVNLKYTHEGLKAEVNAAGETFEQALEDAWARLDSLISNGLGASAMMPALEAPKEKKPYVPYKATSLDDDIPF